MRVFDRDGNDITPEKPVGELEHICTLGGEFDETVVEIVVYSEKLDTELVSQLLEAEPTKAWNPHERYPMGNGKTGRTRMANWGKWILHSERDSTPVETKIKTLLAKCTSSLEKWRLLSERYDVRLIVVGYIENWNRELDLSIETLKQIADRHLALRIDVYYWGADEDET